MTFLTDEPAPVDPAADAPTHIVLLAPFGVHVAAKVLPADADLLVRLKEAGVGYRAATDTERRIGGFPD